MKVRFANVKLVAIAAGLAMVSAASFAQDEIVVESPRAQPIRSALGAPIDVITVKHRVSYKDIDISTNSGAKVLEQRIKDAAKDACKQIDTLYPHRTPVAGDPPCEKTAVDDAMVQANAAIATAEKSARK